MKSEYKELVTMARKALENSYSPYSKSKVGAAILTKGGGVYVGCNIENASFPITSCAEKNAISAAISAEGPQMEIQAISIACINTKNKKVPITPCGACRQAIIEFGKSADVIYTDDAGDVITRSINDLLPYSYSAKTLKDT